MLDNRCSINLLLLFLLAFPAINAIGSELVDLDLDSLMATDIQITSAMKRSQSISQTPSSIYVLTAQNIQLSGVRSIPEALKLIPGMQVRQVNQNQWAISMRFAAGRYTSTMLVMIDGQSYYDSSVAGVYWESIDLPMEDIDRIEIVRDQGGTLWGVNVVNGVVNIITKHSIDTQGNSLKTSTGSEIYRDFSFRHGGQLGKDGSYRVFGKSNASISSGQALEGSANDKYQLKSTGARLDYPVRQNLSVLAQLSFSHLDANQTLELPDLITNEHNIYAERTERTEHNALIRMEHQLSPTANQMLQLTYGVQSSDRLQADANFKALDVDYQINALIGPHQVDWGVNYRNNRTRFNQSNYLFSENKLNTLEHYGIFSQAQFNLLDDQFHVVVGNKSEYNSFTDWEHQPNLRVLYNITDKQNIWIGRSKGVRVPSFLEYKIDTLVKGTKVSDVQPTGIDIIDNISIKTKLMGLNEIESEVTHSEEFGYRYNEERWSFDLSLFSKRSKNVQSLRPTFDPLLIPQVYSLLASSNISGAINLLQDSTIGLNFEQSADLRIKGGEIIVSWRPIPTLSSEFGYSLTEMKYSLTPGTIQIISNNFYSEQLYWRSTLKLNDEFSIYGLIRKEDGEAYSTNKYTALDVTLHWNLNKDATLSLIGKNLFSSSHIEYANTGENTTIPTYVEEEFSVQLSLAF